MPRSLVIIGAGFSGAALAMQVLAARGPIGRVWLVERSGRFGPGLAYSTPQSAHLLNVRASKLSALAEAPNDFADWLRPNTRDMNPGAVFATRSAYGAYLETHVRRLARDNRALTLVRDEAVSCRIERRGVKVKLASGSTLDADYVVLATGHDAPATPAPFRDAGVALLDPWGASALAQIPPEDDVLLLGSGLTMIDVVLSLTSQPRTGTIYALSRRGLTPRAHADMTPRLPPVEALPARLSEALHAVRREIRGGARWQHVIDRLRAKAPQLWRAASPETQARFLRHLRPWWETHRHRTAPHIGLWIAALQSAGMVRVLAGRVASSTPGGERISVQYRARGGSVLDDIKVAHVVNCTGANADIAQSKSPLMQQLLADGVIRAHWTRLGIDVGDDGAVLGANDAPHARLFALGPLTQGAFWEITAVPEIRARAADLAARLNEAAGAGRRLFA